MRTEGVNTDSYLTNFGHYPQTTKEKLFTQLDNITSGMAAAMLFLCGFSANSLGHGKILFLVENSKSMFVIWVGLESVLCFTVWFKCAPNFSRH